MKDTPGWFDFADFYDFIANHFNEGIFVEIGVWKGLSIKYLAEKVKNKPIKIYGIDTFKGTPGEHDDDIDVINNNLFAKFLKNVEGTGIEAISGRSDEVHILFQNKSIDFLFIDADHHYESVKTDLYNWMPKIKKGGIISGHDYAVGGECGVIPAVNEFFGQIKRMSSSVWYYENI